MAIKATIAPALAVLAMAGAFHALQAPATPPPLPQPKVEAALQASGTVAEQTVTPAFSVMTAEALNRMAPAAGVTPESSTEVNIYSSRQEVLLKPVFDAYTQKTGVTVNFITDKAGRLIQRLKEEGEYTPADILLTSDVGNLERAAAANVLASIRSSVLESAIPAGLRDPEGYWFALSKRARIIVYHKDRVQPEALSTYEDLADPKWKGRLLLRSGKNEYNQSLLASVIAADGEEAAKAWVEGMVANLAQPPYTKDSAVLQAIASGEGDVGLVNSYYAAQLMASENPEDMAVAAKLGVFFPNAADRGVHVNISGGGVTRHAPHPHEAKRFLEYLVSSEVQRIYAEVNYEYPVSSDVDEPEIIVSWGDFKADARPLSEIGPLQDEAARIMQEAGWD